MRPLQTLELLEGPRTRNRKSRSSMSISDTLRNGLPFAAVSRLKVGFELTDEFLAKVLDVNQRTLSRMRNSDGRLSLSQSDRLYRVAGLLGLAQEVFESRAAGLQWLSEPQIGLNQRVPMEEMLTEAGAEEVRSLLFRIEYSEIA